MQRALIGPRDSLARFSRAIVGFAFLVTRRFNRSVAKIFYRDECKQRGRSALMGCANFFSIPNANVEMSNIVQMQIPY